MAHNTCPTSPLTPPFALARYPFLFPLISRWHGRVLLTSSLFRAPVSWLLSPRLSLPPHTHTLACTSVSLSPRPGRVRVSSRVRVSQRIKTDFTFEYEFLENDVPLT